MGRHILKITDSRYLLIVDASRECRDFLAKALTGTYRLEFLAKGGHTLERARTIPAPDLILLGVGQDPPDLDGFTICHQLKSDPLTRQIPLILMTDRNEPEQERRGLDLGVSDFIEKPISLPILLARIKIHLDLKMKTDLLADLATTDALTGLPNRRCFEETLAREWQRELRECNPVSLILVDIDNFKTFNDHYGHGLGDECLKHVASSLAATLHRPADMVARYAGEEFIALLPMTESEPAALVANAMRKGIESMEIGDSDRGITVSLGVATGIPSHSNRCDNLLEAAEGALFRAKETGRNQVCSNNI